MEQLPSTPSTSDTSWRPIFAGAEASGGTTLQPPLSIDEDERRAHQRVPVALAAKVHDNSGSQAVATHDLSASGACIAVDIPLEVGSVVDVDVDLPDQDSPARVQAEVRWARKGRAGVVFRSGAVGAIAAFVGTMLAAPTAEAAKTAVPTFDPNADVVLDMKAGGERPDEFQLTQAFEQQYSSFDECVAEAKKNPNQTLPGDVDVEVLLNPKGHEPLGINAKLPNKVDKRSLRECLRGAVAAADYPSYDGPPVVVTFSFELDPGTYWEEE